MAMRGEDFDIDQFRGMEPVQMMFAMRKALEFAMPPVGLTVHTANFGGYKWVRNTWRCEVVGCWYVCTPRVGDTRSVEELIEHHRNAGNEYRCPTPPRRESLPSGLSEIEKLWREVDDVVDAIKAKTEYRGMSSSHMLGYVRGLAFSIVMKDKDLWPDVTAVSKQAGLRWKMRRGLIPYEATPTRHANDFSSLGQQGGWRKDKTETSSPATTARKSAPVKATARKRAAPAAQVSLPAQTVAAIRAAKASGMFSDQDLASTYGVTVAQIQQVMG